MNDVDRIYSNSVKWLVYTPLSSMTSEDKTIIVRDVMYVKKIKELLLESVPY